MVRFAGIVTAFFIFSMTAWAQSDPQPPDVHPSAVTYSDAYQLRAKIHKIASFATLPLFGTEFALGESLYRHPTTADTKKSLHVAVGTGIIGLFGVNAVTGIWNMLEDRQNPKGHTLRLVHGILMLTANAGFVATAATGPHTSHHGAPELTASGNRSLHRDLAFGSMGVGTIGYTLMLFGNR
jgi:hypothetical protein